MCPSEASFSSRAIWTLCRKQSWKKRHVILAKIAQHTKVEAQHLRNIHESQILTAASLNFTRAKHAMAVSIDQDGDKSTRVIDSLPNTTVLLLYHARVELREDLFVDKTVMILSQQIKNIAGEQEALIYFNRAVFERR